ncbi:MAG: GatB/YqeY domain-containing protein [Abyssibacter sp.]|uniref:GatB/YqeY domain-containing protein n=1 Tax=Abyssibacter sp. TaxID=2320200 RepID=UPI000C5F63DE|nr:glutamyl-tRNA amidotransferase [Nevskiales bacterium]MEC9405734.1 GatB/YqeY domain-containing protein [Pseudomonadota bacterium]
MSALKDRITADMKTAMREKDKERLATIRMLTAAIKQREVDERIELTDDDVVAIVEKLVKQRREAEAQYRAGDRPELADQEAAEAALLTPYLPAQLDEADIDALIEQAMADTGAESMRDMGKVMGQLKPKVAGRTDMSALSAKIKARLAG